MGESGHRGKSHLGHPKVVLCHRADRVHLCVLERGWGQECAAFVWWAWVTMSKL